MPVAEHLHVYLTLDDREREVSTISFHFLIEKLTPFSKEIKSMNMLSPGDDYQMKKNEELSLVIFITCTII